MKKKNLNKHLSLGILMAFLITGSVNVGYAEDSGGLWDQQWNGEKIVENVNLNIKTENVGIGYKGTVNVKDGDLTVNTGSNGIQAGYKKDATVNIFANNIKIDSGANGIFTSWGDDRSSNCSGHVIIGSEERKIDSLIINGNGQGIDNKRGSVKILGANDSNIEIRSISFGGSGSDDDQAAIGNSSSGDYGNTVEIEGGTVKLIGQKGKWETTLWGSLKIPVNGLGSGIKNTGDGSTTTINSNTTEIEAARHGIRAEKGIVNLNAKDSNIIKAEQDGINFEGVSQYENLTQIKLNAGNSNYIEVNRYGIRAYNEIKKNYNAPVNIHLTAENGTNSVITTNTKDAVNAIYINTEYATVNMLAQSNIIQAGNILLDSSTGIEGYFGDKTAIYVFGGGKLNVEAKAGEAALTARKNPVIENLISGTVRTEDKDSVANIKSTGNNYIYSSAHGPGYDGTPNLSAVFARNKGEVNIDGDKNFIATYCEDHAGETAKAAEADPASESERVVWAQGQGKINIKGQTQIIASRAEEDYKGNEHQSNNMGIAVTAGSEHLTYDEEKQQWLDEESTPVEFGDERSTVNIEYNGAHQMAIGEDGNLNGLDGGRVNYIAGDVVAGVNGLIKIGAKADAAAKSNMYIKGNLLAGNGGIVNVDLGDNGILYGRVDDYGEANLSEHVSFYNPVFSNKIYTGGAVNLKMGSGSKWTLDGQSWITNLAIGDNSVIDMSYQKNVENTYNQQAHALTIRNIGGYNSVFETSEVTKAGGGITAANNIKFIMDLNEGSHLDSIGEGHKKTDMVYIQNGKGNFKVEINKFDGDPYKIAANNTLRFATVGKDAVEKGDINFSEVRFNDGGIYDITFKVDNTYKGEESPGNKDENYNGGELDPSKPGNGNVDNENSYNFFLTDIESATTNDGAKVIVDMSQANYSNAVYMDRLNKRMGEMRYINNEEDEGLWVRMRHARVGKDNAFKYNSNMYEIGYDEKQECDNGMRRVGVAIDYMHGDTTYSNVGGKGEVSRRGVWLYDTWLGDKGHYADYVLKWGHLANDYEIHNKKATNKINGEYSNNVFSISAEYGRKKDIGNDWYIEPQAQLQYARVTAADYVTTQGTEVSVSSIDSLIARAGFRLGKDLSERSSIYFKGDVLHEFCGNQNIYAKDKTGVMDRTYENKGTWYDLGLGFATELNKDTYFYADYERAFGNDNDKTYQVNVGLNWSF